ncbi:unnamed protein product [Bathycoccus prasinos]
MGCVFGMQIMQPFHMATTAVGAFNENRIPTIQFLTFCQNGGEVYNDGIFSFPELKNGSQFRAISSMDGYVLLGTSKSEVIPAGKITQKSGAVMTLKQIENFPITAITSFLNEGKPSFLVATWAIPSKLVRFDVTLEDLIEQGPSLELTIGSVRSGVSTGQNFSYFVSDAVPSELVTIDNNNFDQIQSITLPCRSIRNGHFVRGDQSSDYEFSFWLSHSSPLSICKVRHNKDDGMASVVSFFQIDGTDDLAGTSIIANTHDGQIIVGTKSYHKATPATVFLLRDDGVISLEKSWKFDGSSTINCIRFDDDIAYLVNRKSPGEIMSINVTEGKLHEQISRDFSEHDASYCPIYVYGGGTRTSKISIGAPLVFEMKIPTRNVTNSSDVQWMQIGLTVETDELSSLEIFFEIDLEEGKDHFFPIFLGASQLSSSSSSTILRAKFSSASSIPQPGITNFIESRVAARDIKSFKLVVQFSMQASSTTTTTTTTTHIHASASSRYRPPWLRNSSQRASRSFSLKASSSKQQQQHRDDFESFLFEWQSELCDKLTRLDGSNEKNNREGFCDDPWEREDGSFGRTRVFSDGDLFEKAACNVSVIRGTLTETRAKTMSSRGRKGINPKGGQKYNACALSLVWHPRSPHVPTFRADIRRFAVEPDSASVGTETNAWYGGGMDLTPYYLDEEDVKHFHVIFTFQRGSSIAASVDYFSMTSQQWGGEDGDASVAPSDAKAFTKAVALSWLDVWEPIAKQKRNIAITEQESIWHQQRRGRYLEFNLLYDRGVKFGLDGVTPDRFESIMVSAPPRIRWDYKATPPEGSKEARLLEVLREPVDWVD